MLSCVEQRKFGELKETISNLSLQGRLKDAYVASILLYHSEKTEDNFRVCSERWEALLKGYKTKTKEELQTLVTTIDPIPLSSLKDLSMKSVVGHQVAKDKLWGSFIFPLYQPNVWGSPNRNLLLFGPPGTGKTFLVRSVVAELSRVVAGLRFFAPKPADLRGKYVGENEKKLEDLWAVAAGTETNASVSVIFIDEIDDLLKKGREKDLVIASSVNTFLQLTGGIKKYRNIFVIGATNIPDNMDAAVLRRMPNRIYMDFPSKEDIVELLRREYLKIGRTRMSKEKYLRKFACRPVREDEEDEVPSVEKEKMGADAWEKVENEIPAFAEKLYSRSFSQDEVVQTFNDARRQYARENLVGQFSVTPGGDLVPDEDGDVSLLVQTSGDICERLTEYDYDITLISKALPSNQEGIRVWRVDPLDAKPQNYIWVVEYKGKGIFEATGLKEPFSGLEVKEGQLFQRGLRISSEVSDVYKLSCTKRWHLRDDISRDPTRVIIPELPFEYLESAAEEIEPATKRTDPRVKELKKFEKKITT